MFYLDLLEDFYDCGTKYLIVGGLAVNLHGVPRVTQDIDIILALEEKNILDAVKILTNRGYKPLLPVAPEELANPTKVKEWIEQHNLIAFSFYNTNEPYKVVDIIISHNLNFKDAFKRKTIKKIRDKKIYIASIDDIITLKESSNREQDKSDIEMLNKVKKIMNEHDG